MKVSQLTSFDGTARPKRPDFSRPLHQLKPPEEENDIPREEDIDGEQRKGAPNQDRKETNNPGEEKKHKVKDPDRIEVTDDDLTVGQHLFEEFFIVGLDRQDILNHTKENYDINKKAMLEAKVLYSYPAFDDNVDV